MRAKVRWQCPPSGRLKINIDGSLCAESCMGGVGVIVRDENGVRIATTARQYRYASSALHMEIEACRLGLQLGVHQGWADVDLESDSILLVAALKREGEDYSELGRIIDDCKVLMASFQSFNVRHILREANGVANRLAHLARLGGFVGDCLGETPAIIQDVLYEDIMSCSDLARGSDVLSHPMHNVMFPS